MAAELWYYSLVRGLILPAFMSVDPFPQAHPFLFRPQGTQNYRRARTDVSLASSSSFCIECILFWFLHAVVILSAQTYIQTHLSISLTDARSTASVRSGPLKNPRCCPNDVAPVVAAKSETATLRLIPFGAVQCLAPCRLPSSGRHCLACE